MAMGTLRNATVYSQKIITLGFPQSRIRHDREDTVSAGATHRAGVQTMKRAVLAIFFTLPLCAQTVTPPSVSLRAAGTQQFTSSITNCLWSTPIGTVNLAGYYQAPLVIPFAMTTTVTCATSTQSATATVSLVASSLPVAGLEYIRGGNFAGSIIVLQVLPPIIAANGQISLNGSTLRCAASGCGGIVLVSNGDGTVAPTYNTALIATHDTVHNNELFCDSTNGTTLYTCSLPNKALNAYQTGQVFLLRVDTTCSAACSIIVDSAVASGGANGVSIKLNDGVTDPGGALVAGVPQWIFYNGTVFILIASAPPGPQVAQCSGSGSGWNCAGMYRVTVPGLGNPIYGVSMALPESSQVSWAPVN